MFPRASAYHYGAHSPIRYRSEQMSLRRLAGLVILVVPSLLSAQRGGGGGGATRGETRANWNQIGKEGAGLKLSNGDLEDVSPIKLLIDKRKDLKLTDAQLKQFKDLEAAQQPKVEPYFKALDSLRKAMKLSDQPSDEDRSRMMSAAGSVREVVGNIRIAYDATAASATALLDETQKKTAAELLDKQSNDVSEMLRDKLGGLGGPAGGRGDRH
jgi:hypothetical protein